MTNRTNSFLDSMNERFFKPRGLYCLIMTYKPESALAHDRFNLNGAISSSVTGPDSKAKTFRQAMQVSSGTTYGELELPEAAPLVFPEQTNADSPDGEINKQNKLKNATSFASHYFDRRAQAEYAAEHPGSSLAVPGSDRQFASRFSDPNHPTNSGSLVSLLSGGSVNLKEGRRNSSGTRLGRARGQEVLDKAPRRRGQKEGLVKKVIKRDVLYLMIVSLPSDRELEEAVYVARKIE